MSDPIIPGSDEIETGPTANLPDEGWHDAETIRIVPTESSKGNPMIEVEWQIDSGEYSGYDGLTEYHEFQASHGMGERMWAETIENAPAVDGWDAAPFSEFVEQFHDKQIRNALQIGYRWVIKENGEYKDVPKERFEDYDGPGETRVYPDIEGHREPSGPPEETTSNGAVDWEEDSDIPNNFADEEEEDVDADPDEAPF